MKRNTVLGAIYLLLLQFSIVGLIYLSLPDFKKAYLLQRINLFLPVDNNYIEKYLFTVPDNWIDGINYNIISSSSYLSNRIGIRDTFFSESNNYVQQLALENDKLSTLDEAVTFRAKFQESNLDSNFIAMLKANIGFNPIRPTFASGTLTTISDRNHIKLPFLFKKGVLTNSFVIALHGRNSSPLALFGNTIDYSNKFASSWNKFGFNVYALGVGSPSNIEVNYPRLGLSEIGSDLAKIEDLVYFIEKNYGRDSHIVIVGISYGAKLAEFSSLLFKGIDGVVSIGGSARYDYLTSEFSLSFKTATSNADIWLHQSLSNLRIYKCILQEKKLLLSSTGISDAGQFGDSGQSKFGMIKSFAKFINFHYLIFKGTHESNPQLEISEYAKLLKKNKIFLK